MTQGEDGRDRTLYLGVSSNAISPRIHTPASLSFLPQKNGENSPNLPMCLRNKVGQRMIGLWTNQVHSCELMVGPSVHLLTMAISKSHYFYKCAYIFGDIDIKLKFTSSPLIRTSGHSTGCGPSSRNKL